MTRRAALLILGDGRLPSGGYAHSGGLEQAIRQGWVSDIEGLRAFLRGRLHTTGLMNAAFAVAARQALAAAGGPTGPAVAAGPTGPETAAPTEPEAAGPTGPGATAGPTEPETAAPTGPETVESGSAAAPGAPAAEAPAPDAPAAVVTAAVGEALADLDAELLARTPAPALRRIGAWLGTLLLRSMHSIHPHPLLETLPTGLQQPLVYGAIGRVLGLGDADTAAAVLHEAVTGPATAAVKLMHIDPFEAHGAIIDLAADLDAAAEDAAVLGSGQAAEIPALSAPLSDFAAELHEGDNVRLFAS